MTKDLSLKNLIHKKDDEGMKIKAENERPKCLEIHEGRELNSKDKTGINILAILILAIMVLIFQLASNILNIDFLAPFPGFNFIVMPICFSLTFIVMNVLNKTSYIFNALSLINKLISWIEKYPFVFKILRFGYKHPLISGLVIGIVGSLVKNVVITIFK